MGASEGQVILFNVMWTESWGVLRCPDNSDMPNWQEAGCELSGRRHWLFVLNQFSHYHSAQTSSKVTSSKRAWLWQKFAEATGYSFWHIYAAPTAHGGAEHIQLLQQWTCRFSTMSAKPPKTSFKMLPSHILNSIGGSVWSNCWETNSSFVLVDGSQWWLNRAERQNINHQLLVQRCRSGEKNGEGSVEEEDGFASAGTTTVRAVNKGSDTGHCAIGVMSERCLSSRSNVTSDGSGCAHSCQEMD